MVLIGAYHDVDQDRFWFLVQNTDLNVYFKLVDGEHLASSWAQISFANKNIDMALKGDYAVADGEYSETALDVEECAAVMEGEG
jgi:hypothetical protein